MHNGCEWCEWMATYGYKNHFKTENKNSSATNLFLMLLIFMWLHNDDRVGHFATAQKKKKQLQFQSVPFHEHLFHISQISAHFLKLIVLFVVKSANYCSHVVLIQK